MPIKRVFIGNLPPDVCQEDLEKYLLPYGRTIGSLEVIRKSLGTVDKKKKHLL